MNKSRKTTLIIGLLAGVIYTFISMLIVNYFERNVSVAFIIVLPIILGAIPVLFSTKEQLQAYKFYLLMPWLITFTFFILSFVTGFEGMICLVIIIAPFTILGSLGAFIYRLIKLKQKGNGTKLYISFLLPFLILGAESYLPESNQIHTVSTSIEINSTKSNIWENTKNVKNIKPNEIETHFIHIIGIPKPINGELDIEAIGGNRQITWEKGIKFVEKITDWKEGNSFSYDIDVDPNSIPPTTLDEHVMIGGKYFDVLKGSYKIDSIQNNKYKLTLNCTYRVTTNLNYYSKLWADFILDDFNTMILEVIKGRCENNNTYTFSN